MKLNSLKQNMVSGMLEEQDRKKNLKKAQQLIQNALFLAHDETRKKRWLNVLNEFDNEFLKNLIQAVIRENFRYKKKSRDICSELNKKLPSNFSQMP